jgi:hypothetical protein
MRPISVDMPVATTTARPQPAATLVPRKSMSRRSPRGTSSAASGAACLSTGSDSPVSPASTTRSAAASSTRASAGTKSPASSSSTSPGTTSAAGTSREAPPRRTRARGAVRRRSAASEVSALYS